MNDFFFKITPKSDRILILELEDSDIEGVNLPLEHTLTHESDNPKSDEEIGLVPTKKDIKEFEVSPKAVKRSFATLIGIILFFVVYLLPIFPLYPCAHTSLAIVCMVCYYWISECIPPFVASFLIPIFAVFLRIGVDPTTGYRYSAKELASKFSANFMDPVILVFLGSLTMSSALSKLEITTRVSKFVLGYFPPSRPTILLVLMFINLFSASLLSNVASTTLTLSLALPIMKNLDPKDPYNKALLFGIAWSGNCGGMITLISSPQNVIASSVVAGAKHPISFIEWLSFGAPVSITLIIAQWGYLLARFVRSDNTILRLTNNTSSDPWTTRHTLASIVTIITILMWSIGGQINWFMGHTGIAALIPVVWFYGSGVLTTDDFNTMKWSTLILLGGGLALGQTMEISGLLDLIGSIVRPYLSGVSVPMLLLALLALEGFIASLLSSTTAASILFPLILTIADATGHAPLLVCLSALMISGAQLFHISSFPNALVSGVTEQTPDVDGPKPTYLTGVDYIVYGWPTILMSILVISTIGYMITSAIGL